MKHPMCGTNLETSQVVLLSTVLSLLAAVLAVEGDGDKGLDFAFLNPPKRAPLCGFTTGTSHGHNTICTYRTLNTLQTAGSSSLASRVLVEQNKIIDFFRH
jgi:hypothetical protein